MTPNEPQLGHLADIGFHDLDRAARILRSLAGQGVTDDVVEQLLPALLGALRKSPDPDRALNNFARWTDSVTSRYTHFQYLLRHPAALDIFFSVCGTSQFFSDILIRNPEYFEILANPGVRSGAKSAGALYRELSSFVDSIVRPELKLEAMRRFKQREILRIGTRDILGLADMPNTAKEFSNLADACVQKCYEIGLAQLEERFGRQPVSVAVIGMGKLGGRELNYSSDIDLMFVCGEESRVEGRESTATPLSTLDPRLSTLQLASRLAEFVVSALSKNLQNGHLFRVDMRLRPEGRFGALVRTLDSYRAYYESWAEPWERQALLKARLIAGDVALGNTFTEMITPFVYRRSVGADFVAAIRHNKQRIERKAELEGQSLTNVKVGIGGIRDVEFAVQLLQLELGGRHAVVRTTNTLEAISRLRQVGALTDSEAVDLSDDYHFLRTVEHRLQILYELQTQVLPTDLRERRLLARRLGYTGAEEFDADYAYRTRRVHTHFARLFYGGAAEGGQAKTGRSWPALLENVESAAAQEAILAQLREGGFGEPERALTVMRAVITGTEYGRARPEAGEHFRRLAGSLVVACARTGNPDASFQAIETLAQAVPNRAEFYRSLAEGDELLDRLCRLGAGSPPLVVSLARRLEWMDLLVSDEIMDPAPKAVERAHAELAARLPQSSKKRRGQTASRLTPRISRLSDVFWDAVAAYVQRERLRIGARDLWGETAPLTAARELTTLAEVVIQAILEAAIADAKHQFPSARSALSSLAVIGLGRLGGAELGYGSDWDIFLAYQPEHQTPNTEYPTPEFDLQAANTVAESLVAAGQELRTRGAPIEIDARLRPEGRFGALVRTVEEYAAYYRDSALTWERQTLVRARPFAGNGDTGQAYMRAAHEAVYNRPFTGPAQADVLAMKRRIEQERLKLEERQSDLKLGHGGMSDIEFTTQLWQMREGRTHPAVRVASTVAALHALAAAGTIPAPDAARLSEAYEFLNALRNRIVLLGGIASDVLPSDPVRLRALAVGIGVMDSGGERAEARLVRQVTERMAETRSLVERLFYGAPVPGRV